MSNITTYFPIANAIAQLFYPHVEVVVHDLKSGQIAAIFNNFSKRKVGDESLVDEVSFDHYPDVFPSCLKTNWDGKTIKSISATIRDGRSKPIGLLCINADLSCWEETRRFIDSWFSNGLAKQPESLFKDDWREKINSFVANYLQHKSTSLKQLKKDQKKELVLSLYKEGAFSAKNAAGYVAEVLELSRATIYNYLKE